MYCIHQLVYRVNNVQGTLCIDLYTMLKSSGDLKDKHCTVNWTFNLLGKIIYHIENVFQKGMLCLVTPPPTPKSTFSFAYTEHTCLHSWWICWILGIIPHVNLFWKNCYVSGRGCRFPKPTSPTFPPSLMSGGGGFAPKNMYLHTNETTEQNYENRTLSFSHYTNTGPSFIDRKTAKIVIYWRNVE